MYNNTLASSLRPSGKKNTLERERMRPQAILHTQTHTAPTHIMIVFNVPEAPSREAC